MFQTGSGTQTNMNANEVIANRAIQLAGGAVGSKKPVHPNDDVNRGQSSNDAFPAVMHVAIVEELRRALLPGDRAAARHACGEGRAIRRRRDGRTHAPDGRDAGDARPGLRRLRRAARRGARRRFATPSAACYPLALGGTAVGTGLNAHAALRRARWRASSREATGMPFTQRADKFAALSAHDAVVDASAARCARSRPR